MKNYLKIILLASCSLIFTQNSFAQGQDPHIIFSGVIIEAKTNEPLPGATIMIPKAGRGIMSNSQGYFSMKVFPGDSIVFSYLGYKKQFYNIPKNVDQTFSAVIELQEDSKMLREVKVYPYNSEEAFKEAFLAMKLPDEAERKILEERFGKEAIQAMVSQVSLGANGNFRYMMNQQQQAFLANGRVVTNPLTNPFAWASFIKDIRNGAFRDKSWKAGANGIPKENITRDQFFTGQN
jgi:hypothetical protein